MGIEGMDKFLRRMNSLSGTAMRRDLSKALFAAGDVVRTEAQRSITRGAVSGKNHVPSAPGEPPMNDTGILAANIETRRISDEEVEVSSDAPYSAPLEFGTSKMAARPFMKPARDKSLPEVQRLLRAAVKKHTGG